MNAHFNKAKFEAAFKTAITALAASEKTTKDTLRAVSREVLEAHHATENIQYVNDLIAILSPMNRKTAVLFFQTFGGFHYDKPAMRFTKKDKKHYEEKYAASLEALNDPHFNIWSWAERELKVEKVAPSLEGFTKYVNNFVAKAQGVSHADMVRAVFKSGISVEAIISVLGELPGYEVQTENEGEEAA
jgi:hydrogenase maturation factor HypF (carbamoyltransferase family)